jgi:hypothetical protein
VLSKKPFHVKRNIWYTIALSQQASVLIVENRDTGKHNTEYADLSTEQHQLTIGKAQNL